MDGVFECHGREKKAYKWFSTIPCTWMRQFNKQFSWGCKICFSQLCQGCIAKAKGQDASFIMSTADVWATFSVCGPALTTSALFRHARCVKHFNAQRLFEQRAGVTAQRTCIERLLALGIEWRGHVPQPDDLIQMWSFIRNSISGRKNASTQTGQKYLRG